MINKDLRSVGIFGTGVANCKSRKRSIFSQNKDALSFILLGFLFVVPAVASVCVCVSSSGQQYYIWPSRTTSEYYCLSTEQPELEGCSVFSSLVGCSLLTLTHFLARQHFFAFFLGHTEEMFGLW